MIQDYQCGLVNAIAAQFKVRMELADNDHAMKASAAIPHFIRKRKREILGVMTLWVLIPLLLVPAQAQDALSDHVAQASAAMKAGKYQAAEVHYRQVVKLHPDMPEALVNLGLSCYLQKKYAEAAEHFEASLKRKPAMTNALLLLGLTRFHLNRPANAAVHLERYVAARSDDFQGVYFLGLSYLALDQFDQAEKLLAAARRMQPRNTDVLYHLAQVYLGRARANPSSINTLASRYESLVQALASEDPNSIRLAQLRAGFFEATGKKTEAIKELEVAAETRPRIRGFYYTLGCLYLEALRYDSAIEHFKLELGLDSPFPRTHLQLAHAYIKKNMPEEAFPHLQTAAEMEPDDAGLIWLELAHAHRTLNRYEEAIAAYQKAIAAGQRDASVYYQLALVAKRAGKEEIARDALSTSEKLRKKSAQ